MFSELSLLTRRHWRIRNLVQRFSPHKLYKDNPLQKLSLQAYKEILRIRNQILCYTNFLESSSALRKDFEVSLSPAVLYRCGGKLTAGSQASLRGLRRLTLNAHYTAPSSPAAGRLAEWRSRLPAAPGLPRRRLRPARRATEAADFAI